MNLAGTSLLALLQISLSMVFQLMLAHALFLVYKLASLVCEAYRQSVVCCVVVYKDLICDERPQTARVARSRVARNLANASIS